jgi:N-acetylmuramoyl-L-alanine amidase
VARVNGVQVLLDAPVQLYEDRTFVPLRFFSEAFGTNEVQWNPASYTVNINSSGTQSANTSQSVLYSEEDFYWLSRIIHAEAEGEPYSGKLAVANVIINRKNSPEFPNTIKGVIFDNNFGIQFTPVANGKIYNRPNAESERAAIEALEGHNNIGNSLYFLNPIMATNHWITINRSFYTRIGGHYFYI